MTFINNVIDIFILTNLHLCSDAGIFHERQNPGPSFIQPFYRAPKNKQFVSLTLASVANPGKKFWTIAK
jgi:hypothetical protein